MVKAMRFGTNLFIDMDKVSGVYKHMMIKYSGPPMSWPQQNQQIQAITIYFDGNSVTVEDGSQEYADLNVWMDEIR